MLQKIIRSIVDLWAVPDTVTEPHVVSWRLDLTLDRRFRMVIQKSDGSRSELIAYNPEHVRQFADSEGVRSPWVVDEELISLGAIESGTQLQHPDDRR